MSSRSAEARHGSGRILAGVFGLVLCAAVPAAEIPRSKRSIDIDVIPGTLGAVRLPHAAHADVGWRADRSLMTCRDCHHALEADEPTSPSQDMRCSGCHPGVGEPDRIIDGRRARAMARLKPDGAIDHRTILFHDYCRDCHKKVQGGELRLSHCKLCCRLASRKEFLGILEDCAPAAVAGGEGSCRPCGQSRTCSRLLGSDAGTYWVASPAGEPGWMVRLSDGAFIAVPKDARALVRCVQTPR